jgi:hypothetical protein
VRASARLDLGGYVRTLRDNLTGVARSSPALRAEARRIAGEIPAADRSALANAVVRWVMDHVEAEPNLYESATGTLARGRGNRAAIIVALVRALGVDASLALARPLGTAAAEAPALAQELDDFSDVLVRFPDLGDGKGAAYVDPRYEHATFGYLPPGLDGAAVLVPETGRIERAQSRAAGDERRVTVALQVDGAGQARGTVVEQLRGWPAIEWAAFAKEWGDDSRKLRQEFEQRWLGQHFPGARLGGLAIDVDRTRPGEATLRYALLGLDLGGDEEDAGGAGNGRMVPPFFRSSPGRRFATLPARKTPLLLGPEVPVSLVARITLPAGAQTGAVGRDGQVGAVDRPGLFFSEARQVLPSTGGAGPVIELRRLVRLPLLRVSPAAYPQLATDLRRIDALERAEIHFSLPPAAGAAKPRPAVSPATPPGVSP